MTKKDFFRIIIKLLTIYYFIGFLFSLLSNILSFFNTSKISFQDITELILYQMAVFLLSVVFLVFFVRNTDLIISLLKLDKYFDDEHIVIGNFDATKWAQFAIIFLGGLLIVNNISDFLLQTTVYLQRKMSYGNMKLINNYYYTRLIISTFNLLIGYILITNNSSIARFLIQSKKDL
jgi:hypothetical protein